MSYCRWSCMNFGCDLYAYESSAGYVIHVALSRVVGNVPPLPETISADNVREWLDARNAQSAYLDIAKREDIPLPHAGDVFIEDTLEDFEARLLELRALGYRFPDYALEMVREEMEAES